jgi:hypothetical protein
VLFFRYYIFLDAFALLILQLPLVSLQIFIYSWVTLKKSYQQQLGMNLRKVFIWAHIQFEFIISVMT